MTGEPYNPLDKINLARSIEIELLSRPPGPLAAVDAITGAGVYALYYAGPFAAYRPIRCDPAAGRFDSPIYVGKAIPKGGRKGGLTKDASGGVALRDRLRQHAASISEASNLALADFWARHLVVEDIWIPLGENMLIETFRPAWNLAIDGFGNKDPGQRRATQFRSPWDVLHTGRHFARKLADGALPAAALERRIADFLAGRPMRRLPRAIEEQINADAARAERDVDDAAF